MDKPKSLLTRLGEALDQYRAERRETAHEQPVTAKRRWPRWLVRQLIPNVGTLLFVVVLLLTIPSLAAPLMAPSATSTSTISYQGRLADASGNPLTGKYNLEFRIYDNPSGGTALWTEMWTGGNAVDVSDGLFNVMLGSINNTLESAIQGQDELYLGITVGTDTEMTPRIQLGSVPFSMQALSVPTGAITTTMIANGAVTQAKLGSDVSLLPPAGSITTTMIADGAVTQAKLGSDVSLLPPLNSITTTMLINGAVTQAKAPNLVRSQAGDSYFIQAGRVGCGFSSQNARTCTVTLPQSYTNNESYRVAVALDVGSNPDNKLITSIRNKQSSSFDVRIVTANGSNISDGDVSFEWIAYGQ